MGKLGLGKVVLMIIKESDFLVFRYPIYSVILQISTIVDLDFNLKSRSIQMIELKRTIWQVMKPRTIFNFGKTLISNDIQSFVKLLIDRRLNEERN